MNKLKSELIKYKRTFAKKLILLIPLFFVIYSLIIRLYLPTFSSSWKGIIYLVFNWWTLIFIPLGMGLFTGLIAMQEKRSGNYSALLVHNTSPMVIWFNKVAAIAIYSLLSTLILIVSIIISGLLSSKGNIPPISQIFIGSFVCWLSSLVLIPIQLWAATWKGVIFTMGIAFIGMMTGVLSAPKSFWLINPWSWATRMICPLIGIHPNGIPLKENDPLLSASVLPVGIFISIMAFLLLTVLTSIWFKRRDVK